MNLLHIDSSILGNSSVSRGLSQAAVDRLQQVFPDLVVVRRDLVAEPIPHLTGLHLAPREAEGLDPAVYKDWATGDVVMEEFLAADIVVLGVGFYNWSIPSQLKSWIDRIAVAGRTFRYSENGLIGLAGGKRVIMTVARGGVYTPGTPMEAFEHATSYLRTVFSMIGISDIEIIAADGLAVGPEHRASSIESAMAQVAGL